MASKPTYEELELRLQDLEKELADYRSHNGSVQLNQQYLQAILNNTNLPIYLKDADLNYILINREFERLAAVTNDQIQGKDDFAVFPEPIARLFRDQDEEVKHRNSLVEFTETIQLSDGEHTFLTAKFPLHDTDGRITAVGGVCTDITDLQQTKETLRKSEQRYRSFIENFQGIAFRGVLETFTPEFIHGEVEAITGYTEEELRTANPSWDKIVHPDDLQMFFKEEENVRNIPHYPFRREYRIIRKDGEIRWVLDKGHNICDEQDRPVYAEGTVHDITVRKNMEQALQESEEKYRKLFTNEIDAICIFDVETLRIIDVNDSFLKLYGYTREEVLQLRADDMSAEPIHTKEAIKKSEKQGDTIIPIRRHKKKDGSELIVQLTAGPYTWKGRTVMYSIIRDITAQVLAEKALRDSEEKIRSVIDSCPEGIHMYRLEPDDRLIFIGANSAADKILRVDHDQFLGKTLEEAFPSALHTDVPQRYREVCRTGKSWQVEQFSYEDDKIQGIYEFSAFQTGPGTMAVFFQDVTAKRRLEEELQKMQKLESVGILAGGIAHDFNNLLTAILGNISMAKLFAQTDQAKVQERLIDAENASLRARDLTQQLLTFSKGGAPVRSAASILEVIRDSTSFMLSGSNVKCRLQIPHDIWPVSIDIGQISQVIQNVVKNADQAMPDGGVITIQAENIPEDTTWNLPLRQGKYVHISVADEGIGIPQKHLAKVFDPYFSTKQEGSGLGLAASYSIIKNHDGFISAESKHGAGTTFHIYLPASDKEPAPKKQLPPKSLHSGERILIMDDDQDVLNVAVNMLNLMGYKTEVAHDGAAAITIYKKALEAEQPIDGAILDLTIPGGLGGLETLRQLVIIDPEVKAIVSSGYANDPIMADYGTHGFKGVVTKPYDMEHLGRVLRDLFD